MSSAGICGILSIFLALSATVLWKFNEKENAPYMDEVFHIPQVQNYCIGNFSEWDPMITTLPGLYITSVGLLKPIGAVFQVPISTVCSVFWLRSVNLLFSAGNLCLIYSILKQLHQDEKKSTPTRILLTSFTLSLFPVLYFFTFLYYTDCGSTLCVLLMYLHGLYGNHKMAAMIGGVAIFFRQTNIVWVVFVAGLVASRAILDRIQPDKKDIPEKDMQELPFLWMVLKQIFSWAIKDRKSLLRVLVNIIVKTWPYIIIGVSFVGFVHINGGIVVGAKDDHQVVLHFPQLFYFASFSICFSFMHYLSFSHVKEFLIFLYKKIMIVVLLSLLSTMLVWKFTHAHRYLLADNRHYTFYVWSKIYRRHELVKFALIPFYIFAVWSMLRGLQAKNILWKVVYCICVCINLIPSPLLEFRYFIIPYLIYRINMPIGSYLKIIIELILYSFVNAVTLYLFMEKPFQWENTSGYQRFLW